jgi:hypothetical protein
MEWWWGKEPQPFTYMLCCKICVTVSLGNLGNLAEAASDK